MTGADGLATGALLVNWIGLARAMRLIPDAGEYVRFHQATNKTFDPFMPLLVTVAILCSAAAALTGNASSARALAITSAAIFGITIVFSLATSVRLNILIGTWDADNPPPIWSAVRSRWITLHIIRTLLALTAFACALLAASLH